jgi:Uma2 family endonuclease
MVTLHLRQMRVPPGQRLIVEEVSWPEFEAIIKELGEHRGTRVVYSQGTLEIVVLLPEHEKTTVIISDLVKVLLDELDMPWESLGSTTLRREDMAAGIEQFVEMSRSSGTAPALCAFRQWVRAHLRPAP